MADNYDVVVTVDEIKTQTATDCKFKAQGITYNFRQTIHREERNLPNLAGRFKVGSHVKLSVHDYSPEGKDWTQHWIDAAERIDEAFPNTHADKPKWQGKGGGGGKKSDFDPALSARQTAAHVAGALGGALVASGAWSAENDVLERFPAMFEMVLTCVNGEAHKTGQEDAALAAAAQAAKESGLVDDATDFWPEGESAPDDEFTF